MKFGAVNYFVAALLMGVLVLGAGCAKAPTDSQLSAQIQSKFKQDSGLQDQSIAVQISGGVVTLSGKVDNDAERVAAARYASTTPGIREIVNNLQVAAPSNTTVAEQTTEPAPDSSAPQKDPRPTESSKAHPKRQLSSQPRQVAQDSSPLSPSASSESGATASDSAGKNDSDKPAETQVADTEPAAGRSDALPDAPPAPAGPATIMITIDSGTTMAIRLVDAIDSETAQPGQTFRATLDSPLSAEWDVAIPAGYNVEGHVVDVKSAGKFSGQAELVLTLDRIMVRDKTYQIQTDDYQRKGKKQSTSTAEKVGAGAVLGAIIGGIAGGGKGAGIGVAAGGGLGGAAQAAGKGGPVKLASETVLNFTLQSPITVAPVEPGPERRRLESTK